MAEAIAAFFDSDADRAVRELWSSLASAGLPSLASLPDGAYPPHISLVGAESFDGVDWDAVRTTVGPDALTAAPQIVKLGAPASFPGDDGVLFLRVRRTTLLRRLHRQFYRALTRSSVPVGAYYTPDRWEPHCTLAVGMSEAELTAAAELLSGRTAITARIRAVGIGALTGAGRMLFTAER